MLQSLLVFVPGMLAAILYGREKGTPLVSVAFLVRTLGFAFAIDAFVVLVSFLRGHGAAAIPELFATVNAVAKFAALASLCALAFPYVLILAETLLRKALRRG